MNENPILANSIGPYLGKAKRVLEKRINDNFETAGFDITLDHMIILMFLWHKDGQNQKSICGMAGQNKTMITRAIDSLEKQNFVLRVVDKEDRRNKLIYITHKGKQIKEDLEQVMIQSVQEATVNIPKADLEVCKEVLSKVFFNLADEEFIQHLPLHGNT